MSPEFSAAVDPIFLYVLDLIRRISCSENREGEEEMERIRNKFRDAEAQLGETQEWELAKYALSTWIDDILIEAPWVGRNWWENNSLEFGYFKTRDRATEFFVQAKRAQGMAQRNALEVFYVCVVLGFRGHYALPESRFLAEQLGLPGDVESWAQRTSRSIQLGQGRPRMVDAPRVGAGAPPLTGKFALVSAWVTTAVLAAFTIVITYYVFFAGNVPTN